MFDRCCQSSPPINDFGGLRYICMNSAGHSDHHRSIPEYSSSWDAGGWIVKDGVRVRTEEAANLRNWETREPTEKFTVTFKGASEPVIHGAWDNVRALVSPISGESTESAIKRVVAERDALKKRFDEYDAGQLTAVGQLNAARATVDRAVRFFSGMSLDRCSTEDQRGFLIHLRALMDIAQPGNANAEMVAKGKVR